MFWFIVLVLFVGSVTLPPSFAMFFGIGVFLCLFYKVVDFIERGGKTVHAALDNRDQRRYEEQQIRKKTLEQTNVQENKKN